MNSNDNIFIRNRIEPSSIRNKYKNNYDDESNNHLYTENNIFQKKKSLSKSKTSSYKTLLNSYSKEKDRYKKIYENKSRAIPSLYLQRAYLKNEKDYNEYLNDKNNKKGLKLEGNKDYNDITVEQYMEEIETYRENIRKLIMKNNWYYITSDEYNDNNKKMKLTPLPSKSRLLMNTNKEKKDFNFAERNAVFMRMVEYTHSLITKEKQRDDKNKLDQERKKIYLIMKSAILTIENWWVSILEKRKENEEKLNQFIEKNNKNIENLVNTLETIFNKKNRKDESVKKFIIEFYRKLFKNNQKYEKKLKKINNNVKVKNVDKDDEIPEILGPEYMVKIWKKDEDNIKKNNDNIDKIPKQNYVKRKTLSSNIPKKLYHYIDENDEMKIYRNNDSNFRGKNIISEGNKNINNKKNLKLGLLRNSNKDIVKAIRINHFNNFDENQLEIFHSNNTNKKNIKKIRNNKNGINKNTKSTSILETKSDNKKIKNFDEKFEYILEKSQKGLKNKNIKTKQIYNNNNKDNNIKDINNIQNNNGKENNILNNNNPKHKKDNNENNIENKLENNNQQNNINEYEEENYNKHISGDKKDSIVKNIIENENLNKSLNKEELNNSSNKSDFEEKKNENNSNNNLDYYIEKNKNSNSNNINNSNLKMSNLKKELNNINKKKVQKGNKTEKNNKLNNLNKNSKKKFNKTIQKTHSLKDSNNNKEKNINNKNNTNDNIKKDNNIQIQNTSNEYENILNTNQQNQISNNNDSNKQMNKNKKNIINNILIKQTNDSNNNSFNEKSNLIEDENMEEKNNIIINNNYQISNFNDSNNELNNNEQINKNYLENTYKKFPSNQENKNEMFKKNNNFISSIEPHNINGNENKINEEIKPKYNYNPKDKKLMRIDSKGIIENIDNILKEDSKPLTIKSKKKIINNNIKSDKNDNPQYNYIQNFNKTNYKFDNQKLQLINTENILIPNEIKEDYHKNLTSEEKIEKFIFLISSFEKERFFNRLVLNYLYKHNVNLNNEELIALLKLGQNNTYQRILNKSLKLNLINDEYQDKKISFKDWVKKFVKNKKDLDNKEEIINKYNEYIKNNNYKSKNIIIKNFDIKTDDKKTLFSNEKDINSNNTNDKNEEISINKDNEKKLINNDNLHHKNIFDLEKYKFHIKQNNNKIPLLKNKRDTSKDIIIPEDLNIAYNLLKQTKVNINELHREFNDDVEKF